MTDLSPLILPLLLLGAIGIPVAVFAALGLAEKVLVMLPVASARGLRPLAWLGLPVGLVCLVLVFPLVVTVMTSFRDATGEAWVGAENYAWAFGNAMRGVIRNNILWLVAFPLAVLILALATAYLFDKVAYEPLAMTVVILPTAISFTAGALIWTQIYSFQPATSPQIGTLNAGLVALGFKPVPWLIQPVVNTLALIFIAVWLQLGIATLILSAAIKNVGSEMIEAARLDGASEARIFLSMVLPNILPAVLVVLTTMIIAGLKVFDIVYVMTNGNFGTNVIANKLYYELFATANLGHASAIAVILMACALPVAVANILQFRAEAR